MFFNSKTSNIPLYKTVNRNLFSGSIAVPSNFIGLHIHRWPKAREGAASVSPEPTMGFGHARSHDSSFNNLGNLFWRYAHPSNGTFRYDDIDVWINAHYGTRDLVYCIYGTPAWAAKTGMESTEDPYDTLGGAAPPNSMSYLEAFVSNFITYTNGNSPKKIKYLEEWNEPNFNGVLGTGFFWGTASEMAQMAKTIYNTAKAIDPDIIVLSPGFTSTTYASQFLNASATGGTGSTRGTDKGLDYIDGLAFHPYHSLANFLGNSRDILTEINAYKTVLGATSLGSSFPLYNTEQGYISPSGDLFLNASDLEKSILLTRNLIVQAYSGVKFANIYAWDDDATLGPIHMSKSVNLQNVIRKIHTYISGKTITNVDLMNTGEFKVSCTGQPDRYF